MERKIRNIRQNKSKGKSQKILKPEQGKLTLDGSALCISRNKLKDLRKEIKSRVSCNKELHGVAFLPANRGRLDGFAIKRASTKTKVKVALAPQVTSTFVKSPSYGSYLIRQLFRQQQKIAVFAVVIIIFVSFGAGFWTALSTPKSAAESQDDVVNKQAQAYQIALSNVSVQSTQNLDLDDTVYTMPLDQLEKYLKQQDKAAAPAPAEEPKKDPLQERKEKLAAYLKEKNSPFVSIADTIAELPHWKLVLAISNAESTMGKHCYTNNCSGIGVEPGHPLWRKYPSTREWAKDLDRLIEKRYKDWTLEKMNGVYNQPGSKNWLLATKQVLQELAERGIE